MSRRLSSAIARHGLTLFERALPLVAGAALAVAGAGQLTATRAVLLAALAVVNIFIPAMRHALFDGLVGGLVPTLLGYAIVVGSLDGLRDPALWSIAVPFAVYASNVALVRNANSSSPMIFALLNTLALVALVFPVIAGRIHWAIAILPFAAFRVAATAADKIRAGEEFDLSRREAEEVAQKILWVSGAWIAGWAGVTP